jgi:transposase
MNVCRHPFKLVDSAISATPVADRCVKSSTQPCNLHRQTLAVEWPVLKSCDFQRGTVIGCHLSNKSVSQVSALLELPRSTVSAVIVKWKRLGATAAQPRSGRPHKPTERDHHVQKHVVCKKCLSSVTTLTTEFQTSSGSNISTITVRRELYEMGFHARAAANKPKITMCNAKCRLEWCKA